MFVFFPIYAESVFLIFFSGEKAYFMGGMSADTSPFDKFVELDLETFKWQIMPAMPTPRYATFAFLIDDKLYVIGKV